MIRAVPLGELHTLIGETLGPTEPFVVDQTMIDGFADLTGDHQWIHVDQERAATGPFGTTIAHGFLTLSLAPIVLQQLLEVQQVSAGVNYGLDRCRFPAAVPAGASLVGHLTLRAVDPRPDGSTRAELEISMGVPDAPRPACVATLLVQYQP